MDLATAENHRNRLQKELDSLINSPLALSNPRRILTLELERLNRQIATASVLVSLDPSSEIELDVENDMMILLLSTDIGITMSNIADLEILQSELICEVARIKSFHKPLPLAYQLGQRVIELLEEEIQKIQKSPRSGSSTPRSGSSTPRSRFYYEELDRYIEEAINAVIERGQQDATSHQVLDILKENSSVVIDDNVKRTVRQRFFQSTFALKSKPPPPPPEE